MVGIGFLGAANIARHQAMAIEATQGAELVAVGSRNRSKACIMLMDLSICDAVTYGRYEEVLQDAQVEAVYISLPSHLHLHWIQHCFTRNKHVIVQTPLLKQNSDEIDNFSKLIENSNALFMDATSWLHHPRTAIMKTYIQDTSNFGKPIHVSVSYAVPLQAENSDNIVHCQGGFAVDCIDQIAWYCVSAILWAFHYDMPEMVQMHPEHDGGGGDDGEKEGAKSLGIDMIWEDGRTAVMQCGFNENYENKLEVVGSEAVISVEDFIAPKDQKNCEFSVKHFNQEPWDAQEESNIIKVKSKFSQEQIMWEKFCGEVKTVQAGEDTNCDWYQSSIKTQKICCAIQECVIQNISSVRLEL